MTISIITPTYNRSTLLLKCFDSLSKQTNFDFEWIIIDDGSTDNTSYVVNEFIEKKLNFPIRYYRKENGGKHTALNFAMDKINGEICCILDSDDFLTSNAVERMHTAWASYFSDDKIGVLSFLRGYNLNEPVVGETNNQIIVSNHIEYRINGGIGGDFFEVIRSSVFKKFPFPIFEDEKFFSEGWLWTKIGLKYQTVYINEIIYITEYQVDGLTQAGRKLRLQSPKAGMINSYTQMNNRINLIYRIKQSILYNIYASKVPDSVKRELVNSKKYSLLLLFTKLPAYIIGCYWNRKHL